MSSNPYSDEPNDSPAAQDVRGDLDSLMASDPTFESSSGDPNAPPTRRGYVGDVPVLGGLMIAQGIFELLFGCLLVGIAVYGPQLIAAAAQDNPLVRDSNFTPEQIEWMTIAVYGTMGAGTLLIGSLTIVAGIFAMRYQRHTLVVVALCCGFFTLLDCYCFPTALALGIYGLIVMLDGPVKSVFGLRKVGWSVKEIKEAMRTLPS